MSKKFFIIIAVILIIFLLALVGYYFILQSNQTVSTTGKPLTFKNFFPFGGDSSTGTTTDTARPTIKDPVPEQINFAVKLRKVWSDPVAGFGLFDSPRGTMLRHIEKSTGHIYETEFFSPKQERISNTTIPRVYEAQWGSSSSTLIARFLEDDNQTIDTFSLALKPTIVPKGAQSTSTQYTTVGTLLAGRIDGFSVLGSNLFSITTTETSSSGFTSSMAGVGGKQIWNSPIRELLPQFVNGTTVALTTKPYSGINGYLYFVDTTNGGVKKILGDIDGLSTLVSPDGKKVLALSQIGTDRMISYTVSDRSVQNLNPVAFPEKCVWSKKDTNVLYCAVSKQILDTQSLTNWYMGSVQFTDDIWKYDLKGNTENLITNLSSESGGESIDVMKPALSDNEQYLVFINKRDGSLWSLDLSK